MVNDLEVAEWREILLSLRVYRADEADRPWCYIRNEQALVVDHDSDWFGVIKVWTFCFRFFKVANFLDDFVIVLGATTSSFSATAAA